MIKTTPGLYSQLTRSSGRIHALLLQVAVYGCARRPYTLAQPDGNFTPI